MLQTVALDQGTASALVFVGTVFAVRKAMAVLCARSTAFRHLERGKPRQLVRDGQVIREALDAEGINDAELLAGLRKLGHESAEGVKLATLEETGHISAVAMPDKQASEPEPQGRT